MRKILLFGVSVFSSIGFAQITVNSTYIATLGDTVFMAEDTTHAHLLDLGEAAGDQVWDFTSLVEQKPDGIILEDPSTAPLYTNFPDADFVGNDLEDGSIHLFFRQTATALDIVGIVEYDSAGNPVLGFLNGEWRFMQFPATMGTTFGSVAYTQVQSEYFGVDFDSTGPRPFIDSLRSKYRVSFYNEIDAWGDVMLPQGTFTCVRQKVQQTVKVSADCYYNGQWRPYTNFMLLFIDSVNYDTASDGSYRWWSDNEAANLFVAQVDFDSLGNPDSNISYLKAEPIWPTGIEDASKIGFEIYPNPSTDIVSIRTTYDGRWNIDLFDINAKKVRSQIGQSTAETMDVSSLPAGAYLIQVTDDLGRVMRLQKIQVLH